MITSDLPPTYRLQWPPSACPFPQSMITYAMLSILVNALLQQCTDTHEDSTLATSIHQTSVMGWRKPPSRHQLLWLKPQFSPKKLSSPPQASAASGVTRIYSSVNGGPYTELSEPYWSLFELRIGNGCGTTIEENNDTQAMGNIQRGLTNNFESPRLARHVYTYARCTLTAVSSSIPLIVDWRRRPMAERWQYSGQMKSRAQNCNKAWYLGHNTMHATSGLG